MERLQKYLSRCGVASRRHAEQMIKEGKVRVNGQVILEMGKQVEAGHDKVTLNGKVVKPVKTLVYLMLNKPSKVISTCSDPQGRTSVLNYVPKGNKVYPVGRLDYLTEGLLLLTNDGNFANCMTHPRYKISKTYLVMVKGFISDEMITKLQKGVILEDGPTLPAELKVQERSLKQSIFTLTIREGRNRQVRRMCEAVGLPVNALKRVQIGPLKLGDLKSGSCRQLTSQELEKMQQLFKG